MTTGSPPKQWRAYIPFPELYSTKEGGPSDVAAQTEQPATTPEDPNGTVTDDSLHKAELQKMFDSFLQSAHPKPKNKIQRVPKSKATVPRGVPAVNLSSLQLILRLAIIIILIGSVAFCAYLQIWCWANSTGHYISSGQLWWLNATLHAGVLLMLLGIIWFLYALARWTLDYSDWLRTHFKPNYPRPRWQILVLSIPIINLIGLPLNLTEIALYLRRIHYGSTNSHWKNSLKLRSKVKLFSTVWIALYIATFALLWLRKHVHTVLSHVVTAYLLLILMLLICVVIVYSGRIITALTISRKNKH